MGGGGGVDGGSCHVDTPDGQEKIIDSLLEFDEDGQQQEGEHQSSHKVPEDEARKARRRFSQKVEGE